MRALGIAGRRALRSMTMARHALAEGLRSLGSVGGDNSLFNDYLKGNNVSDLRKDLEAVGSDMKKVLNANRRQLYGAR